MIFAESLRKALAKAGITQSDLARRTHLSRDAISSYMHERSLPSDQSLSRIARVLRIEAATLLPARLRDDNLNSIIVSVDGRDAVLEASVRMRRVPPETGIVPKPCRMSF